MAQLLVTQMINATIDKVWPLIADITKHSQWSPKPYSVELVSGDNGAVGSKYRSIGFVPPAEKNHANDVEITEIVPNARFAFNAYDANGTFKNTFKLESAGQSTQVTFQHDFPKMKGVARVLLPILLPLVGKKDAKARLGMLKMKAESK